MPGSRRSAERSDRRKNGSFTTDFTDLSRSGGNRCRSSKNPIVFNDLEEMRDSIGYGTRMNRLLHSPPFHKLREFVAHEATFDASKGG